MLAQIEELWTQDFFGTNFQEMLAHNEQVFENRNSEDSWNDEAFLIYVLQTCQQWNRVRSVCVLPVIFLLSCNNIWHLGLYTHIKTGGVPFMDCPWQVVKDCQAYISTTDSERGSPFCEILTFICICIYTCIHIYIYIYTFLT